MLIWLSMVGDEGDKRNFERIYRKYEKDVFRRIRRLLKNNEDAEDAMQNTWLAIAENITFFRTSDEISVRAYILRIARNQAVSLYRKRRREEDMTCDMKENDIADDSTLIRVCEETDINEIVRCINALDEKYSDVLNLYYLHRHSAREIASLLHLNEHTVRSRIARGKDKLIQLLKEERA